ncbi:hypothetical protein [Dactylosporangium sp. CA-233914]|uniref:hypothetical protein n=1 Tax=Dactylosporangium sp. CA-233914 TaxID=3239934 RepID=UPI003D8EF048
MATRTGIEDLTIASRLMTVSIVDGTGSCTAVAVRDHGVDGVVLPCLVGMVVDRVETAAAGTYLLVQARAEAVPGVRDGVHGRFQQRGADTPIGGPPAWLHLRVRRFNCGYDRCAVRTFAE